MFQIELIRVNSQKVGMKWAENVAFYQTNHMFFSRIRTTPHHFRDFLHLNFVLRGAEGGADEGEFGGGEGGGGGELAEFVEQGADGANPDGGGAGVERVVVGDADDVPVVEFEQGVAEAFGGELFAADAGEVRAIAVKLEVDEQRRAHVSDIHKNRAAVAQRVGKFGM